MKMLAAVTCLATILAAAPAAAQPSPALAGKWNLNFQLSQFPREIGFAADWMSGAAAAQGGQPATSGGRGRGGSSGGGGVNAFMVHPESADDAKRLEILTAEVRNPAVHMTISETADAVTIADEQGQSRTIHPNGREEDLNLGGVPVATIAKWDAGRLVILYRVAEGRDLRYTYAMAAAANPPQLALDVELVEKGGHEKITRVYDRARMDTAAAGGASSVAQPRPGETPAPPAVGTGADAELKGLTNLGVVVEDLSSQAIACGLKQDTLESTVTKSLTDAGFRVRRNSDEDTYFYVDVLTTSLPSGLCVSRYDVFLYSHTTATLSYQKTPALVQVELLHKGGLAGGAPAAHADGVVRGVKDNVDQFAARIRDAGK